jgi:predicted ABC-type ATPase
MPELIIVAGCNAAGKSTFIRTRLNELEDFEIFMTDVYKNRTQELVKYAIDQKKNILIETVFNDPAFKNLADYAKNAGYKTSLIVLFLDSIQHSAFSNQLTGLPLEECNKVGLAFQGIM